jgi:hypothetical protein
MLTRFKQIVSKEIYDDFYNIEYNTTELPSIYEINLKYNKRDSNNPLELNYQIDTKAEYFNGILIRRRISQGRHEPRNLYIFSYKFTSQSDFTNFILFIKNNIAINITIDYSLYCNLENNEVGFLNIPKNIYINKTHKIFELQIINISTEKVSKYINISFNKYNKLVSKMNSNYAFFKIHIPFNKK